MANLRAVVAESTERLLDGMVGLAALLRAAPFVIAVVFSGMEAENVAVGVVAAGSGNAEIALGTVFGGSSFLVCVALGLAAVLFPLTVRLPRGVLVLLAATPVAGGLTLLGGSTSRPARVVLLVAFAASMAYLVRASRRHQFLDDTEVLEAAQRPARWWRPVGLTALGLAVLTLGAELVNYGAETIIDQLSFPAAPMGMIITPARPSKPKRSSGKPSPPTKAATTSPPATSSAPCSTSCCSTGVIAVATPINVPTRVLTLDWPFLTAVTGLATAFLWYGRLTPCRRRSCWPSTPATSPSTPSPAHKKGRGRVSQCSL